MADLIDRENATKLINELLEDIHRGKTELHEQILEQLAINITCLPPVDTERHAHWVKTNNDNYICSNCHCKAPMYKAFLEYDNDYCEILTDFCPNCGCKMTR